MDELLRSPPSEDLTASISRIADENKWVGIFVTVALAIVFLTASYFGVTQFQRLQTEISEANNELVKKKKEIDDLRIAIEESQNEIRDLDERLRERLKSYLALAAGMIDAQKAYAASNHKEAAKRFSDIEAAVDEEFKDDKTFHDLLAAKAASAKGWALYKATCYRSAIQTYDDAIKKYDGDASLKYSLAAVLADDEQYDLSFSVLQTAIQQDPGLGRLAKGAPQFREMRKSKKFANYFNGLCQAGSNECGGIPETVACE